MTWLTQRTARSDVVDAPTFAFYVQQEIGVPIPYTQREWLALRAALKKFFATYPDANFDTLCDIVAWARAKKRHPNHCYALFSLYRYAVADRLVAAPGVDTRTESRITEALSVEMDPKWRSLLIGSEGAQTRREVLAAWEVERQSVLMTTTAPSLFT